MPWGQSTLVVERGSIGTSAGMGSPTYLGGIRRYGGDTRGLLAGDVGVAAVAQYRGSVRGNGESVAHCDGGVAGPGQHGVEISNCKLGPQQPAAADRVE